MPLLTPSLPWTPLDPESQDHLSKGGFLEESELTGQWQSFMHSYFLEKTWKDKDSGSYLAHVSVCICITAGSQLAPGQRWGGVRGAALPVYSLTAGPQYPPSSICGKQAQVLYHVLTRKKKKIHNEVDSNEVDSSSSNPCCSRVNSIFRVESFRDTNIKKKKGRISPTE